MDCSGVTSAAHIAQRRCRARLPASDQDIKNGFSSRRKPGNADGEIGRTRTVRQILGRRTRLKVAVRDGLRLYISQLAVDEARAGDSFAAHRRLLVLRNLPLLDITPAAADVASGIPDSGQVPRTAATGAAHIAIAAVHGVDSLATQASWPPREAPMPSRTWSRC